MEAAFEQMRGICAAKAQDYSPGDDVLHNFKHGAQICRMTPFQFLIALVSKQYGAIATAIENSPEYPMTSYESLVDKIRDVQIYMVLLECMLEDLQTKPRPVSHELPAAATLIARGAA